ncbi:hypothetical protein KO516_04655 [Citreicella sp. C3M06]|uniref:GTA head formation protein, RCAP_rcc01685 family n=1 Tax=Roseobacteraceae TaxID=2854170 RepID=UPI001C08AFC8|nr:MULTISPECIES: hypothetical protein [Roseobacteraceae]MBU2960131.1 hypothetical protein [Citreicella sp. C3M06]MDO6586045.1 hypothetical protein [Salipiger sp. 1_MG-2023]
MSERRIEFEPFACAPALKLEAHERVSLLHVETLNARLDRLEQLLERVERRLWLAVYGVTGVILSEGFLKLMSIAN